jgi:hypothetical protein
MSYQTSQPAVVTRTRQSNASPLGMSAGTTDLLFSAAVLGVGAVGGYFAVDYIMKKKLIDNLLEKFGLTNTLGGIDLKFEPEPAEDKEEEKESKFAHVIASPVPRKETFDRTTKINSYAYPAMRQFTRKPVTVEDGIDISQFQDASLTEGEFNQIVTDTEVYNNF